LSPSGQPTDGFGVCKRKTAPTPVQHTRFSASYRGDSGFAIADKLRETGGSRFGWATEAADQGRGMECNFAWVWRCWHALSFSCRTITLMPKAPIAPGGAAEGYGISIRADRPNMDAAREARTEAVGSLKINIATLDAPAAPVSAHAT
jgi:hypothetical protein